MTDAVWVALTLHMSSTLDTSDQDSLAGFIGCADLINHAIITRSELVRGLGQLAERGWLEGKGSSVRLSDRARGAIDASIAEAGSPTPFQAIKKRLDASPANGAAPAPTVDAEAFERAHGQHSLLMDSIVIKMKTRQY
jgi:hypothetical protein